VRYSVEFNPDARLMQYIVGAIGSGSDAETAQVTMLAYKCLETRYAKIIAKVLFRISSLLGT